MKFCLALLALMVLAHPPASNATLVNSINRFPLDPAAVVRESTTPLLTPEECAVLRGQLDKDGVKDLHGGGELPYTDGGWQDVDDHGKATPAGILWRTKLKDRIQKWAHSIFPNAAPSPEDFGIQANKLALFSSFSPPSLLCL